ncbi:MAG: PaaI family thioesterase [Albidovulum sp.]|nr:PaaI family thioesterase [Albidovulum sp.]MDE0533598.1 PaaI family thioesterase [Albidovulum sp.]
MQMRIDDINEGFAVVSLPYDERLIGDPESGVLHGGAVSTLLDTCAGAAVVSHPLVPDVAATLDLRIEYMRSAAPGERIRATAECYNVTRTIAFVRATANDESGARPVAEATGIFALVERKTNNA